MFGLSKRAWLWALGIFLIVWLQAYMRSDQGYPWSRENLTIHLLANITVAILGGYIVDRVLIRRSEILRRRSEHDHLMDHDHLIHQLEDHLKDDNAKREETSHTARNSDGLGENSERTASAGDRTPHQVSSDLKDPTDSV